MKYRTGPWYSQEARRKHDVAGGGVGHTQWQSCALAWTKDHPWNGITRQVRNIMDKTGLWSHPIFLSQHEGRSSKLQLAIRGQTAPSIAILFSAGIANCLHLAFFLQRWPRPSFQGVLIVWKFWKGFNRLYFNQTETLEKAASKARHTANVLQVLGQHRNFLFLQWQKNYCKKLQLKQLLVNVETAKNRDCAGPGLTLKGEGSDFSLKSGHFCRWSAFSTPSGWPEPLMTIKSTN